MPSRPEGPPMRCAASTRPGGPSPAAQRRAGAPIGATRLLRAAASTAATAKPGGTRQHPAQRSQGTTARGHKRTTTETQHARATRRHHAPRPPQRGRPDSSQEAAEEGRPGRRRARGTERQRARTRGQGTGEGAPAREPAPADGQRMLRLRRGKKRRANIGRCLGLTSRVVSISVGGLLR